MGLNIEPKKTYLSMNKGKVCLRCKADTPGAVTRLTKDGEPIHELQFSNISGHLLKISTREGKFGPQWILDIRDLRSNEDFVLQFPYSGGYTASFFSQLPNIDLTKEIKFCPYSKEVVKDDGKVVDKVSVYLHQDGKGVDWFFTKDDMKDLPPMVKIKVKGKDTWDDSAQLEYFERMAKEKNEGMEIIAREYSYVGNAPKPEPVTVSAIEQHIDNDLPMDDIPVDDPHPDSELPF